MTKIDNTKNFLDYIDNLINQTKALNIQELRLLEAYLNLASENNCNLILNYYIWALANFDFEVIVRDYYDLKFMDREDLNDILTLINMEECDTNTKCQKLFDTLEEDLKVRGK